jgi:hypothetical protein
VRQGDPHWTIVDQKLDVDGIGMSRGDSNNEGLIAAVHRFPGPAIKSLEVVVHIQE